MKASTLLFSLFALSLPALAQEQTILENRILETARRFEGQADPDRKIQNELEKQVKDLIDAVPQPAVKDRLNLIYGPWRQVWGPYDYRNSKRGVDPSMDVHRIYQVVFEGGYYYNVNPNLKNGLPVSTGLLRGEYVIDPEQENVLKIHFTNLRKIKGLPKDGLRFIDLPALSEAGRLEGETTVLPGFFVRLFFGGGSLKEVYTSSRLRLAFGSGKGSPLDNYLYVLERVEE